MAATIAALTGAGSLYASYQLTLKGRSVAAGWFGFGGVWITLLAVLTYAKG